MLQLLPEGKYDLLYNTREINLFPVIMAVVYGVQGGKIYVDDIDNPQTFFIVHKSALCYLYTTDPGFNYPAFLEFAYSTDSIPQYFHIYNPGKQLTEAAQQYGKVNIRLRQRMRMRATADTDVSGNVDMKGFTAKSIEEMDMTQLEVFNVSDSPAFKDTMQDSIDTGIGWVIFDNGKPMNIWYAVCVANKNCETDILTLPEHRGKGSATIAGALILKTLHEKGVNMDWDLFTDNMPSLKLARHFNYETYFEYDFLSIFKVKES